MRSDCEEAVAEALGRSLRRGEANEIESAVSLHMRLLARKDPEAWAALGPYERLQEGAKAAAEDMVARVKKQQQRVALQIQAHDRIENTLRDAFDSLPDNAKPGAELRALSGILAFDAKGKGMVSAEMWGRAIGQEALGRLLPLWHNIKGFAGLLGNPEFRTQLVKELFGEETGNSAAKEGAKAWMQVTDELRDRANAAGMDIGKLDEWHYPQSHSQARVAGAGLEKWMNDLMPMLDRDKYLNTDGTHMGDERVQDLLTHVYDSIITDGQNKVTPGKEGYGITANRMSQHRVVFFKDADSYLSYQGDYGDRNLLSTLSGHIRSISRDIGLNETLGPDAEKTFRYFNDRTKLDELRQTPGSKNKINSKAKFNEALFDHVAGKTDAVNQEVADVGQAFRNFEVFSKLGKVALTALGDEAGMSATAFANKIPWTETMMGEARYLNPLSSADRDIAGAAGLGMDGFIGGLNRFGSEDFNFDSGIGKAAAAREFTSKLANTTLRASGAEALWNARRQSLGRMLMAYVGKTVQQFDHFRDINEADQGMLARKGVTENDWQTWKLAEPENWNGKDVLTPKSIRDIPDAELKKFGNPDALRRHASSMLLGHVLEETGMGVMESGARERTAMTFGTQSGTVAGELVRSTMLFKGFEASMMMKHWARAGTLPTGDKAMYVARLMTIGAIMGGANMTLRALSSGQNPPNIVEPKFWAEAMLRGGGLGFYGDFIHSEMSSHDTTLIPALMGPLATEAESVWNLTGAAAFKASRGERVDEGANALRFARSEIGGLNMWYTQAAVDHLLWNDMQEAASPGYLERMQGKAQATRGTSWYWDPHESLPQAAPDMGQMFQPERGAQQLESIGNTAEKIASHIPGVGP